MVVVTGAAVATVITGGAAAGPITAGLGTTVSACSFGTGTATTVVGTVSGGAVTGTAAGTGIGAVGGITTATGIGGMGAGCVATGGLGLLIIGTSLNSEDGQITYDCWKPVVHDKSTEPSSGMSLKEVVCHPNVAKVTMTMGICTELPSIVIENIWNETFEIQYLLLHDTGEIVCHAKPFDEWKGDENIIMK